VVVCIRARVIDLHRRRDQRFWILAAETSRSAGDALIPVAAIPVHFSWTCAPPKHFHTPEGNIKAVEDVSFSVTRGEVIGIVGESGCRESVTALVVAEAHHRPGDRVGEILYDGTDLVTLARSHERDQGTSDLDHLPGPDDEPQTRCSARHQVAEKREALMRRELDRRLQRALRLFKDTGIQALKKRIAFSPHFSGGMRSA